MESATTGHGVQVLIDRLRAEGIAAGRAEADRLVEQARGEIETLRAAARSEAEELLRAARERIGTEREAALGAIQLAFRDSTLRLKEEFLHQFGERLRRQVREELADPALLRRLIVAALGRDATLGDADADALIADIERRMLADGLPLSAADGGGLRIRLADAGVELHATDEAITALLLEHLLPRVRRQLDGAPRPAPAA